MSIPNTYNHITQLTVDLSALASNIDYIKSKLRPQCELMPVIKADAYGSGVFEIVDKLQKIGIRTFAVAIMDEAIALRKNGFDKTMLILYPDVENIYAAWDYDLHINVYSMTILKEVSKIAFKKKKMVNVHVKIDTGMHRLGFLPEELDEVIEIVEFCQYINVAGVMSHFASSEDPSDDDFTRQQIELFDRLYKDLETKLGSSPKRHLQNSGGILRFSLPYEIARIGIVMYGIDPNNKPNKHLSKVHTLIAKIIQIKEIDPGESVSYNRNTILEQGGKIGIVNIGYADGVPRVLGNRRQQVYVNGHKADIIGNICMDSIIIDLSDVDKVEPYDEVEIFGHHISIEEIADQANTIPYEILCGISYRIKRIYTDA